MCQSPSHSGVLIVCIANTGILGISVMNLKLRLMLVDSYSTFSTTAKTKEEIKRNNLQCRIYVLKRRICLNHTRQKNLYLWFSFVKSLASSHIVGSTPQRNQYILYSSFFFFGNIYAVYVLKQYEWEVVLFSYTPLLTQVWLHLPLHRDNPETRSLELWVDICGEMSFVWCRMPRDRTQGKNAQLC